MPDIPGIDTPNVLSLEDLLQGRVPVGHRVAVIGSGNVAVDVTRHLCTHDLKAHDEWCCAWGIGDPAEHIGGTLGVITMEDVLEELVGDIWDEKDVVENEVVTRPDGGYELDGAMTLSDFLELLDWNEDALDDADSTTVGGWTLERFGTFPKVGDSFRYENLTVTVLAMDGRRVERVLVQPDPDADKDKDA